MDNEQVAKRFPWLMSPWGEWPKVDAPECASGMDFLQAKAKVFEVHSRLFEMLAPPIRPAPIIDCGRDWTVATMTETAEVLCNKPCCTSTESSGNHRRFKTYYRSDWT